MNTDLQITHIRGGSYIDHHAIEAYQWIVVGTNQVGNGYREDVVRIIRTSNGLTTAFVQVGDFRADCETRTIGQTSFLETFPDSTNRDNLLSLPQF